LVEGFVAHPVIGPAMTGAIAWLLSTVEGQSIQLIDYRLFGYDISFVPGPFGQRSMFISALFLIESRPRPKACSTRYVRCHCRNGGRHRIEGRRGQDCYSEGTLGMQEIAVQSVGAPPERHADRVIAAMLRDLAKRRARIAPAITSAIVNSKDGGPRAQQRMVERIHQAGAQFVHLKPGTRGRYELTIIEVTGWNPINDEEIGADDLIPAKPWLAVFATMMKGRDKAKRGAEAVKSVPVLFVSHHALSRCAQRFALRTSEHIIATVAAIWNAVMTSGLSPEQLFSAPPQGHRLSITTEDEKTGIVVVLCKHDKRQAVVATTMLFKAGEQQNGD
jgi:hypothetical protein